MSPEASESLSDPPIVNLRDCGFGSCDAEASSLTPVAPVTSAILRELRDLLFGVWFRLPILTESEDCSRESSEEARRFLRLGLEIALGVDSRTSSSEVLGHR